MAENNDKVKLQVLLENHRTETCRHYHAAGDVSVCRRGDTIRDTDCGGEIQHCDEEE